MVNTMLFLGLLRASQAIKNYTVPKTSVLPRIPIQLESSQVQLLLWQVMSVRLCWEAAPQGSYRYRQHRHQLNIIKLSSSKFNNQKSLTIFYFMEDDIGKEKKNNTKLCKRRNILEIFIRQITYLQTFSGKKITKKQLQLKPCKHSNKFELKLFFQFFLTPT